MKDLEELKLDYLHGKCNLLAIVLSKQMGLQVNALVTYDGDIVYLDHAYCVDPNNPEKGIDAGGVRDIKDIESDYEFEETIENVFDFLVSNISNHGEFSPGDDEEIKLLINNIFVLEN